MRILTAALVIATLVVTGQAKESTEYAGEVTASALNLRAGPGEAYQPVLRVPHGTRFVVVGVHPNAPEWLQLKIPGGFPAWVAANYIRKTASGDGNVGVVKTNRLLVRPRASTKYHQLAGRLELGETVRIVGAKTTAEGDWYQVMMPERFPLFAHRKFVRNIGPAKLALVKPKTPGANALKVGGKTPRVVSTKEDARFILVEKTLRKRLIAAKTAADIKPLKRSLHELDRRKLSIENRERRVSLWADMLEKEHNFTVVEIKAKEDQVQSELDARLAEIDRKYKARLREIKKEFKEPRHASRFTATGIVKWKPDIFGRHPEYRIEKAGQMRYFIIAPEFDLARFSGKRVGVIGITDPESGTGFETVMVKRIEILGNE